MVQTRMDAEVDHQAWMVVKQFLLHYEAAQSKVTAAATRLTQATNPFERNQALHVLRTEQHELDLQAHRIVERLHLFARQAKAQG